MQIYSLVLSEILDPNPEKRYSTTEAYCRPGFTASRKVDSSLLRTCRAVYREGWHLPDMLREQVFVLTKLDQYKQSWHVVSPPRVEQYKSRRLLVQTIRLMRTMHGLTGNREGISSYDDLVKADADVERERALRRDALTIANLRVFTSPWALEMQCLHSILATEDCHPRRITLTIRHVDWSGWELDRPLELEGGWLLGLSRVLSPSTTELVIELETVPRKKEQAAYIATHISRHWFFKRQDGVALYPDATEGSNTVTKWTGRSTYGFTRWVRDESEEGKIQYHVIAVPFRVRGLMRQGAKIGDEAARGEYDVERLRVRAPGEVPVLEPGTQPYVMVPWAETDQLGLEKHSQFLFGICGNCRRPPWLDNKHAHWDRW